MRLFCCSFFTHTNEVTQSSEDDAQRQNEFNITLEMAKGHTGVVYDAIYNNKRIAAKRNKDYAHEKHINNEYSIIKSLHAHPNIIQVYDLLRFDNWVYMIMEMAKTDLFTYNERIPHEQRTEEFISRMHFQMAESVSHCHSHFIIHNDIKLENFLVLHTGLIVLCDFGFAHTYKGLHTRGSCMGTIGYASPQLLDVKNNVQTYFNPYKNDIWSLGISCFALLFNFHPFASLNYTCNEYQNYKENANWKTLTNSQPCIYHKDKPICIEMKLFLLSLLNPNENNRFINTLRV